MATPPPPPTAAPPAPLLLTAAEVRSRLAMLDRKLTELHRMSGVSTRTLTKIRDGETVNPGIDTVNAFWPSLLTLERHEVERAQAVLDALSPERLQRRDPPPAPEPSTVVSPPSL